MSHSKSLNDTEGRGKRKFDQGMVTVEPKGTRRLPLGSYLKSDHKPEFDLLLRPALNEQLGISLEQIDIPGTPRYILFYSLQNFSEKSCQVTVTRRRT